jgi:hypothetical protein
VKEKIVLFAGEVDSPLFFVIVYWAATRTSTGSGSSVMGRVGLAKV